VAFRVFHAADKPEEASRPRKFLRWLKMPFLYNLFQGVVRRNALRRAGPVETSPRRWWIPHVTVVLECEKAALCM
jgi:hypothetical protein